MNEEKSNQILLLKKNNIQYIMTTWSIGYHLDDNKNFIVISGIDNNGMFFQIKTNKIYKKEEYANWVKIEI